MIRASAAALALAAAVAGPPSCGGGVRLDASYAPDHRNYLCMNYTRPTPLPCKPVASGWQPRWLDRPRPAFVIYAWWPPVPQDFGAYAAAGFNMALTGNWLGEYCAAKGAGAGVTFDELFDENVAASDALARLGLLTVFNTDNMCNAQLERAGSVAYGNRTGGIVEAHVNLTARAAPAGGDGSSIASKGHTVPELEYIASELQKRGVAEQFGAIQLHDDTVVQSGQTIAAAEWLKAHAPWLVPIVNQVGGNSGPQTLHRAGLFVSSPEQYPIQCDPPIGPDGNCTALSGFGTNASAAAAAQMNGYAGNAVVDARFSLQHWPLFWVGMGPIGALNGTASPDNGTRSVRSDSLVRWMAYSAIAYGAKGLNWYCWGGGIWW